MTADRVRKAVNELGQAMDEFVHEQEPAVASGMAAPLLMLRQVVGVINSMLDAIEPGSSQSSVKPLEG